MTGFGSQLTARLFPEGATGERDPVGWVESTLGEHLWSAQRRILESVAANRYTAVQSAHGIGKSYTASRAVAWWLSDHPVGEAFALTTAPTGDQINAILWRELDAAHERGRLRGKVTGTSSTRRWHVGRRMIALGRKSADFKDSDRAAAAFQGIHAPYLLIVLDEASGIQPWLWDAIDGLTTTAETSVLAIGNPMDPTSRFAEVCAPGSGWEQMAISVFDTPAFTGERVPPDLLRRLPSKQWVEERKERWGEDSPMYTARVLGEFPEQSDEGLISPALIRQAQELDLSEQRTQVWPHYGVDVARTGSDETVVYANWRGHVRLDHSARGKDTMETAGEVAKRLRANNGGAHIDVVGLGYGVYDRLREQSLEAWPFNGANRAHAPHKFINRRAEAYWHLREAFERGEVDIDPDDDQLAAQLLSIRWFTNSKGLTQIESKDDMRKRGVPSPDRADALCMALCTQISAVPRGLYHAGLPDLPCDVEEWGEAEFDTYE